MQHQPTDPSPRRRRRLGLFTGVMTASLLGVATVAAQSPSPETDSPTGARPVPVMRPHLLPGRPGRQPIGDQRAGGRWRFGDRAPGGGIERGGRSTDRAGRRQMPSQRPAVTVAAIAGPVMSLTTADGWTRDVDTTGVTITRNGGGITLADVHVGDAIRLGQTRNDDGTWTVNRIDVQLAVTFGTVASVADDSFTATEPDGASVTVRVTATTRWVSRRGQVAGITSLTVGSPVAAKGVRAADGSIDAIVVGVGSPVSATPSGPPAAPPVPAASPSPGASSS